MLKVVQLVLKLALFWYWTCLKAELVSRLDLSKHFGLDLSQGWNCLTAGLVQKLQGQKCLAAGSFLWLDLVRSWKCLGANSVNATFSIPNYHIMGGPSVKGF